MQHKFHIVQGISFYYTVWYRLENKNMLLKEFKMKLCEFHYGRNEIIKLLLLLFAKITIFNYGCRVNNGSTLNLLLIASINPKINIKGKLYANFYRFIRPVLKNQNDCVILYNHQIETFKT